MLDGDALPRTTDDLAQAFLQNQAAAGTQILARDLVKPPWPEQPTLQPAEVWRRVIGAAIARVGEPETRAGLREWFDVVEAWFVGDGHNESEAARLACRWLLSILHEGGLLKTDPVTERR